MNNKSTEDVSTKILATESSSTKTIPVATHKMSKKSHHEKTHKTSGEKTEQMIKSTKISIPKVKKHKTQSTKKVDDGDRIDLNLNEFIPCIYKEKEVLVLISTTDKNDQNFDPMININCKGIPKYFLTIMSIENNEVERHDCNSVHEYEKAIKAETLSGKNLEFFKIESKL
ncbi:hypothetical protein TRFO_17091 [Tritrichomonas foetus]|uniref:Uncharacterized protein n=1 Tax=Tritrichomonas foetus TaxID=1144522 RepID=A0A1J4KNX2_9EUKA|nr:hypothetical protein TRFO_17091 [Tritrichomonas foetus]|eukprot:OHT12931.1 hypothetical protein TRFO_17091 [Tritrichomonas foetus]